MATTGTSASLISELASEMIAHFGMVFEKIDASASHSTAAFPAAGTQNYLYVLYTGNGMPLEAGAIFDSMGARDINHIAKWVHELHKKGVATHYRVVDLGSKVLAVQMLRLVKDLFHAVLPLNVVVKTEEIAETAAEAVEAAAPKRRGRPRKATQAAAAPKRRGRPRKVTTEEAGETAAPKRRGRPRKVTTEEAGETAAPKRRGRPRKVTTEEAGETAAPNRRGRPRKVTTEEAGETAAPKRRGRPRKATTEGGGETAAPKRRGRPRKAATEEAGKTAPPERRGRPRKAATKEAPVKTASRRRGGSKKAVPAEVAPAETVAPAVEAAEVPQTKRGGRSRKAEAPQVEPVAVA